MRKLSMFQVIMLTCGSYVPLLFWVYPRYATQYAGIDGQWAVLGTCLIGLVIAWLHGQLCRRLRRVPGEYMADVAFGRVVGRVTAFLFLPGYLLFLGVSVYSFSITMQSVLPATPRLATVTALTLVAVVGALYGLEALGRVAVLILPLTLVILYTTCLYMVISGNMVGIYLHPVDIGASAVAAVRLVPIFFGINIFLMFNTHFDHRGNNPVTLAVLSMVFSSVSLLLVYVTVMMSVGWEGTRTLAHPIEFVLQAAQVQGNIVQRFGILFVFLVTSFETLFLSNHLWALSELTAGVFGAGDQRRAWPTFLLALLVICIYLFIPNQQAADWMVNWMLLPLSWLYLFVEPAVKLATIWLRRLDPERTVYR
ncbi:MAG: GerAB/ArcD/ProY family transporter [Alicyclobacillus sp.]|nr:GerAB/ArcD/ProY family transporter [Alicyclobacillus sp.]